MEVEECHDRAEEIFDEFGLGFLSSPSVSFFAFAVGFCGPLGIQFFTNPVNRGGGCPNAFGEGSSPFLLLHNPMIASSLRSASQSGITGRKQSPVFGSIQDFAIGGSNGVWCWAGGEGVAHLFFNTKVFVA